jgi:AAA15 family ATPase/GTPase
LFFGKCFQKNIYYMEVKIKMSIRKLVAKNFKGIAEHLEFDLAPLTIFLGQNSSGKSSCLHALAALAQTVKLGDGNHTKTPWSLVSGLEITY